jgi:chemosensory pili system protein ChpA (sensor histidine kinase/response regulator)
VSRLQRSVRQTCRLTGKQTQLHVGGADTLMDGEVLNELIDPLMHVLRNAVDHGIESPAQRSAAGKPEEGNIWLDFTREGNNILVRCRDDGAGFDFAAIRSAAERRGLLEPGQAASEEELKNLVLMPNFSTRSEVTQTSGRGVGLDVVYSHVLGHGGSVALKSATGQGSTTELRLPVSLISTHALLVRLRGRTIAVADRGIEQILHAADGKERKLGDQITFQVGEQLYPLKQLGEILGLAPDPRSSQRSAMPVLLVRDRTGITAVAVQEVTAGTDLVVKEFGRYVPRLPGIVGATILGDGAVTPVLDLPELMSGARRPASQAASSTAADAMPEAPRLPLALVVDDSLSARRALAQVMAEAGYEVREARDGLEAVEIAQGRRPDVVLADMEMPRMNGIELTAHLRARPETADLPVIMVTSRSTAKHRQQAEAAGVNVYLTKPFLDDQLLDHVATLRGQL